MLREICCRADDTLGISFCCILNLRERYIVSTVNLWYVVVIKISLNDDIFSNYGRPLSMFQAVAEMLPTGVPGFYVLPSVIV